MVEHNDKLRDAARNYRRAHKRAEQIVVPARTQLSEAIRAAYASGMRKSDIIRATDHVWTRGWVDEIVRDLQRERRPPTAKT